MKKFCVLSFFLLQTFFLFSQEKPKLVVGIVVDQMRQDYLFRFYDKFQEGGFKRLMKDGYQFKNVHHNHIPTYTAPGHASIYTGTTPSNHGIIANHWYDRKTNMEVNCVFDSEISNVGGSNQHGKKSPKNLQVSTITDALLLTSNFQSKVVSVSIKDRGSILPAGHNPTGAYWFDSNTGNFMTSTYYMPSLPMWVEKFNNQKLVKKYLDLDWNTLLPINEYFESTLDDAPYERPFRGKESATFPFDLSELVKKNGIRLISSTPFGNSLVVDMALAAIEGEKMGADDITDFLAISFSSTDYVGHAFGPNSVELEDTYLRLDLDLKRFLDYLDHHFNNDYLLFLTADHGVSQVPLFLQHNKMIGGYSSSSRDIESIKEFMNKEYGEGEWISNISNEQVFLNYNLVKEKDMDLGDIQKNIKSFILTLDRVADVYTAEDLAKRSSISTLKRFIENGYNTKMSGDVIIRSKSNFIDGDYGNLGTTHGSGYTYDTHVPMLFFGTGIKPGTSIRQVKIIDIAPTLSMLLDISLPSAATGQPLQELFE